MGVRLQAFARRNRAGGRSHSHRDIFLFARDNFLRRVRPMGQSENKAARAVWEEIMRQGIIVVIIAVLLWQGVAGVAFAGECSSLERDRMETMGEKAGRKLVGDYGGGRDIRVRVGQCFHNRYSEQWKADIRVEWNGAFFRSNHYELAGELRVADRSGESEFSRTSANDALEGLEFFGEMAATAIVLGALASESDS